MAGRDLRLGGERQLAETARQPPVPEQWPEGWSRGPAPSSSIHGSPHGPECTERDE
jgi:hypothetical protein